MNTNNHHFEFKIWDYTIKLFYSLFGKLLALLFPLLSLIAIGILVLLTSTVIYSSIRYSLLPRAIIHEPVYFNFATSEPVAKIDILESNRQWISNRDVQLESAQKSHFKSSSSFSSVDDVDDSAVSTSAPSSSSFSSSRQDLNTEYKRYFKPSATYTFHSTIEVANSRRNIELGKFMLSIRLFDSTGRVIASSARPVVVPYQSPLSVTLQTLFWSPLVIIGLFRRHEKHSILVTFMDDFAEPGHMQPPTAVVELSLSTNQADVTSTYLTVMPALYGIT